jgi:nitric oxide reductase subunit B
MEAMVWLRVPGDIVFAIGAAFLALYVLRLLGRGRAQPATSQVARQTAAR